MVDSPSSVSSAGAGYRVGRRWGRRQVEVTIAAGSVQISEKGKVITIGGCSRIQLIRVRPRDDVNPYQLEVAASIALTARLLRCPNSEGQFIISGSCVIARKGCRFALRSGPRRDQQRRWGTRRSIMTQRFVGRCAIVTGASRGIGRAVAVQLASEGADVAIVARSVVPHDKISGSLNETAEQIRGLGSRCVVIGTDLSDDDDRARIVPKAIEELGHVDILVNNAAAAIYEPPATYSLKHRRLSMEINYQAPADLIQALVPHLADHGEGWIVNVTSSAAKLAVGPPFEVKVEVGLYGATKAALNRLTNAMGASLYGTGIRVNAVMPRSAVLSEGADVLVGGLLRPDQLEPMETMVESVTALCACEPERTGQVYVSLELLAELA